jgi:serine/threonine protein kinase
MGVRPEAEPTIQDAVCAIADGTPVAWNKLEQSHTDPGRVESLHLLEEIACAFRVDTIDADRAPRDVLFRWGGLEVESRLGAGSFGEVYRAFDPWLRRQVALKLFRSGAGAGLDEARRLARLRHRNVLSVYGCGEHDGRPGLWSELIEGRTLAEAVAAEGAVSSEEALRIGHDLAQALAVVHAAGLVHGDVKAENVMRESGGRIVLMDFGGGGDARLLASKRLISGTPRYLPPEVLDGAPLSFASDIYALGVLLFLLLSGRLPYAETDASSLREEQRHGTRPTLHALRPELDPALCAVVENCLADDPAQRPGAQALAAQISTLLHPPARAAAGRHLPIAALAAACVALLAVAALWLWPKPAPAWDSSVKFLRVADSGDVELAANSTLRVGDTLRLQMHSTRDTYIYVLNEDAAGDATVLFPQEAANLRNPQHGGDTLQLPGGTGSSQAWEVTADSAREEFVVVAALQALPQLDTALAAWQRAHVAAADDSRAVGAIVDAPAVVIQGEHLRRILATLGHDPAHLRVWQYRFAHQQ